MNMKRAIALGLVAILMCGAAGCRKKESTASIEDIPYYINEMEVNTIDELPDWTGKSIDLTVWYGYGANNFAIGKLKGDDKFQAEMKRVSGINFSEENSFDNAGESGDSRLAKMASTKAWPHIGVGVEASIIQDLCAADKLYDLTELVPKYMPNYMKYVNCDPSIKKAFDENVTYDGKKYTFSGLSNYLFRFTDPNYSVKKYEPIRGIESTRNAFWIRDDILKMIYPQAKTVKELEEIYVKNGEFTAEEMTDITIKSREEFRTLLEKINDLNLTENGRKVWPFYTHNGMDNWDLLVWMNSLVGTGSASITYFAYYDVKQKKLVNTVKQDWFKDLVKFYNQLIIDGLASEEALVDTKTNFDQKKNNDEYAIIYGTIAPPTAEKLQAAGKNHSYRKVFIDIPMDESRFIKVRSDSIFNSYQLTFFKNKMTEAEVEQVLRFLDFFYTDAGMKFANWGPKKAGLYKENLDGTLEYTDKKFEAARLYGGDDSVLYDYGFSSFPPIYNFISPDGINKYQPKMMYANFEKQRIGSDYTKKWNYGYIEPSPEYPTVRFNWDIWNFPKYVEGVKEFWNARQVTEDALKTVFTAKNDEEFENYYNKLIETEEKNGYDDECFEKMNKVFKERNGSLEELENWSSK